jgi:hypothetical protein
MVGVYEHSHEFVPIALSLVCQGGFVKRARSSEEQRSYCVFGRFGVQISV